MLEQNQQLFQPETNIRHGGKNFLECLELAINIKISRNDEKNTN